MPCGTRRGIFFLISLDLAYKLKRLVIVAGATIGPVEAEAEHVRHQLMAHRGGALEEVEVWPDRDAVIHEDLAQTNEVAHVRVADHIASQVVEEGVAEYGEVVDGAVEAKEGTPEHLPQW
jgi:hypothetical protein